MSATRAVVVIGAGGHGKVVVSTLRAAGFTVAGVYDHDRGLWNTSLLEAPILGAPEELSGSDRPVVLGLGDNRTRERLAELGLEWHSVVHPIGWMHDSVEVGEGTVVFAGAIVQPETRIGRHCIVNTGATIDHDCTLGDFSHVAPGAQLAGGVTVGTGALLGIGCSVIPGVSVGDWAVVGAGAAVVSDVAPGATVKGVPAR